MNITQEKVKGIVEEIWSSVLNLPIEAAASDRAVEGQHMTATIHLSGAWTGAMLVECGRELARKVAMAMFAMEPDQVSDSELSDALGEVVNIAGGNIKALLPDGTLLSLPTVVEGTNYSVVVGKTQQVTLNAFECDKELLVVKILELVK